MGFFESWYYRISLPSGLEGHCWCYLKLELLIKGFSGHTAHGQTHKRCDRMRTLQLWWASSSSKELNITSSPVNSALSSADCLTPVLTLEGRAYAFPEQQPSHFAGWGGTRWSAPLCLRLQRVQWLHGQPGDGRRCQPFLSEDTVSGREDSPMSTSYSMNDRVNPHF